MFCCFGGCVQEADQPRASNYAAKENTEAVSARVSKQQTAVAEVTRKESSTDVNEKHEASGYSESSSPMDKVKQKLGTMKLVDGQFGTVNLEVAVKMVVFGQFGQGGVENDKRAITEAAVCMSVVHPNVTATYHYDIRPVQNTVKKNKGIHEQINPAADQDEWKLTLVQELCDVSLADALESSLLHNKQTQQPNMVMLLWTLADIAKGIAYIHSKNIIHGDLKPENVLQKHDADNFGLCSTLDASKTHISGFKSGTPFYCAPEISTSYEGRPVSDVYSFGILMIEMYRKVPPWVHTPNGFRPNKAFMIFPPDSPRPYIQLAQRCLSKDPKSCPYFGEILESLTEMLTCFLDGSQGLERQAKSEMQAKSPAAAVTVTFKQLVQQLSSRPLTEEILHSARRLTARGEIDSPSETGPSQD